MWITFTYGLPGINSPADEFSSLFRYGQQVNSKKIEILLLLLFKTAKSAEPLDTTRIYKRDAILEIQYSGGTFTSTCLSPNGNYMVSFGGETNYENTDHELHTNKETNSYYLRAPLFDFSTLVS